MKVLPVAISLLLFRFVLPAQNINPGRDDVFRQDELATIRLTLSAEDKAYLLDPENDDDDDADDAFKKSVFQMTNSKMDTILPKKVGVRLRGNTSRSADKKPFKIDFREFDGKKFFGYKKFNLKPNVNDPSQVREPLTLQYYREMNVPAARTTPTRLYMNDEYMGTYIIVEQVDDEFLELRYGHSDGFLYKCTYPATLEDDGQINNVETYESELDEDNDTRTELAHFVAVLNHVTDDEFPDQIDAVFDVELYLRQLAVEAMLAHWDGYSFNMNNYYLFYNGQTGKFEYFPYDTDNTWAIDFGSGIDWTTRDLHQWSLRGGRPRPLTTRILNVPAYHQQYVENLKELLELYFNDDFLNPIIASYKTVLDDAVHEDTYFDNAFGFTYENFVNSFDTGMTNHVRYGITGYLHGRAQSAKEQLGLVTATRKEQLPDQIYPNPSRGVQIYFYSGTGISSPPSVYSSTGVQVSVTTSELDAEHSEISLPAGSPTGLYLLHINSKVYRWAVTR